MVGWSRRNRENRERRARAQAREDACIAAGCKCYCHAPREPENWKAIFGALLAFVGLYFGFCGMLIHMQKQVKTIPLDASAWTCTDRRGEALGPVMDSECVRWEKK